MRTKIVAGNWKMAPDGGAARRLAETVWGVRSLSQKQRVILIPPAIYLGKFTHLFPQIENWYWGAQNCSPHENGAFTGEISTSMLRSLNIQYVLVGHSERRQFFGENTELLKQKIDSALKQGLSPIYCCGETLEIREKGNYLSFVEQQLHECLWHLSSQQLADLIIAYEPVWAIGTGKNATPEQAQEVHAHIRKCISEKFGKKTADNLTILYGGSCKPENAAGLFSKPDIDGGLVGGASLIAEDFLSIIQALPG